MQKFCYRCGALEEEKGPLIDGLCRDCFLSENRLIKVPEEFELEVCTRCGALLIGNSWQDVEESPEVEYLEAAKDLVTSRAEFLQLGPAGPRYLSYEDSEGVGIGFQAQYSSSEVITVDVEVRLKFSDSEVEPLSDRTQVDVKLVKTTCGVCDKQSAKYYEAVLQVRGQEEIPENRLSRIYRVLGEEVSRVHGRNRDQFVSQVKRKHGGLDLYISSAKLAKGLARFLKREYGATIDESAELVGQTEDGEDKYRVTVVARLPF